MNVSHMEMTVVIGGSTFNKVIGDKCIYSEEYGVYIKGTEQANTFVELISLATRWLEKQD